MTIRAVISLAFCLAAPALTLPASRDMTVIRVDAAQVVNSITPWMTGSCIEDVNHEIYGGLYDQKIFGESFEEPPASAGFKGWTAYGGSWQPEEAGCRVVADYGAKLVRADTAFADGSVEADVKLADAAGGNAGLLVRVQNPGVGADNFDGYEISLSARDRTLILGRHRHDWRLLKTAQASIAPGEWHHLRVELTGPRLRLFMDGDTDPRIDFTDAENPLLAGSTALRTWNSNASFRYVRIRTGTRILENRFVAEPSYSVSGMWDVIRTGNAEATFLRDNHAAFNGTYSQKIKHGSGTGSVGVANRGLNRWGISVKKGQTFAGRIYLRARALQGPVTIALQSADGARTYAVRTVRRVAADWTKFSFNLKSLVSDKHARFAIWIDRPGVLWADQAVLMGTGSERFHGLPVRADIADALVAEGVTFLRYGGSMVNAAGYRWKKMIGDPDRRPPYIGTWYPCSTNGFGIFDFLNFCDAAHIESAFAINIEETDRDAADLADYLTSPVTNPWGRKRAEDGHPAPYRVRYLEIGNEECIGHDDPAAYDHYIERFRLICQAMHARNPAIKLVCAAWWRPDSSNVERVFKALDGEAAAWDLHVGADDVRSGDSVAHQLDQMRQRLQKWNPATTMRAVIFEENGGLHDLRRALGHATTLDAARRYGDFVLADCPANCLQPWKQNDNGWDQGQIFFTADHVWGMPPYYAQQMAARTYEPLQVRCGVAAGADLYVSATRSRDAKTLVLSVVNVKSTPRHATVALSGFNTAQSFGEAWTLTGDLTATNPPDGPETVRPRRDKFTVRSPTFVYTFPAHSVVVLHLRRGHARIK